MSRATIENEMLSRLGLPQQAGPEEVEAAYSDLVAYLESAPAELHDWARAQVAAADEAYAVLSDPSASIAVPTKAEPAKAAKAATVKTGKSSQRSSTPGADARRRGAGRTAPRRLNFGPLAKVAFVAAVLLGTLGAGYMVYASDLPSVPGLTGTPAPEASQQVLDTARIATLMQAIQANPNDTASLQELADIYFQAGDYTTSSEFENKVLAINPNDTNAHLALGAAAYNLGDSATAETHWRKVLAVDPQNVEAHYDLGFMYFSADPPDVDKTIAEWQQVVAIAPDSQIAQTVSTHLQTLQQWKSSASPQTSAAPAPVVSPAAAPAAPAAPTATPGL